MEYEYTYNQIRDFEIIKTYTESSHFDRKLVRDNTNGLLFLYEFYEHFMEDDMYTTWILVKDEADADWLNKERNIIRPNGFRFDDNMKFIIY
jgi:hypothetical protein